MTPEPAKDNRSTPLAPLEFVEKNMIGRFVGPRSPVWAGWQPALEGVPPLPTNIVSFLKGSCPIKGNGELAMNTHFLTVVPGTFGGRAYSIQAMHQHLPYFLERSRSPGHRPTEVFMSDHGNLWSDDEHAVRHLTETSWVLQYGELLPGTEGRSLAQCLETLARHPLYRQALFMEHVGTMALQLAQNKRRLFVDNEGVCMERVAEGVLYATNSPDAGILHGLMAVSFVGKRKSTGLSVVVDLAKLV